MFLTHRQWPQVALLFYPGSPRAVFQCYIKQSFFLMVCWPAFRYNLTQMKSTRCTLLLCIFISTCLHVSGNYVPIIRRTFCIYATLVYFVLYGWLSGLQQARQPPIQSEKYRCHTDTVSSPDDGHIVARNMYRSWNKYTNI